MRGGEHPLRPDERGPAQVLVERVDERHLPAPLAALAVLAAHHAAQAPGGLPGRAWQWEGEISLYSQYFMKHIKNQQLRACEATRIV